jgi:hypothetical protein
MGGKASPAGVVLIRYSVNVWPGAPLTFALIANP